MCHHGERDWELVAERLRERELEADAEEADADADADEPERTPVTPADD